MITVVTFCFVALFITCIPRTANAGYPYSLGAVAIMGANDGIIITSDAFSKAMSLAYRNLPGYDSNSYWQLVEAGYRRLLSCEHKMQKKYHGSDSVWVYILWDGRVALSVSKGQYVPCEEGEFIGFWWDDKTK